MKAVVKDKNSVKLSQVETPVLDELDNVLVKVRMAAICRTDINVAENIVSSTDNLILGHEFYGEVVQVFGTVKSVAVGDVVSINPTIFGKNKDKMCGVDVNGAFAEFIKVPEGCVYKLPKDIDACYGAFTEPVAASLAVLNAKFEKTMKVCVYGKNRISDLTAKILKVYGYESVFVHNEQNDIEENTYDVIIETVATSEDFRKIVKGIKKNGLIILKSRQFKPVEINVKTLVEKDIKMQAVNYGSFEEAVTLLGSKKLNLDDLIGTVYKLEDFDKAFAEAKKGEARKIFLEV